MPNPDYVQIDHVLSELDQDALPLIWALTRFYEMDYDMSGDDLPDLAEPIWVRANTRQCRLYRKLGLTTRLARNVYGERGDKLTKLGIIVGFQAKEAHDTKLERGRATREYLLQLHAILQKSSFSEEVELAVGPRRKLRDNRDNAQMMDRLSILLKLLEQKLVNDPAVPI